MSFDPASLIPLGESMARAALPTLSTILGAVVPFPFSMMVGPAFAAIAAALGQDPVTATPASVQAAVDADPAAAAAKLQPVEDHFKAQADAAQAELDARLKDVQDARATEVQYVKAGSPIQWAVPVLGAFVTLGFVAATLAAVTHTIDQGPMTVYLVTTFGGGFLLVMGYFFGSSVGSKEKDAILGTLAGQPQVIQGPGSHVSGGVAAPKRAGR